MRTLALLLALVLAPQAALASVAAFPETALRGDREISAIRVGSNARQLAETRQETACFYDANASAMTDDPINHRDPTGAMLQVPRQFTLEQRAMGLLRGAVNFAGRVGGAISSLNPWGPTLDEVHEQMDRDFAEAAAEYGDSVDAGLLLSMALVPGPKGSRAAEATGRGNIIRVRPGEAPVRLTPRAPPEVPLIDQVNRVHSALDPIAQDMRTTAGLKTDKGVLIGGGKRNDLTPAQRAVAQAEGATPVSLPMEDAEVTVLTRGNEMSARPQELVVTRDFCPACQQFITKLGGKILNPRKAIWPFEKGE